MTKIEKIGNLTVFAQHSSTALGDYTTIKLYNGADEVFSEDYVGLWTMANGLRGCINDAMLKMDYLTIEMIEHFCPVVHREHNGNLLIGEMSADTKDYFKRVDDTIYYKHYTHRPMM